MKVTVDIPDVLEYGGKKYRPTGEYRSLRKGDVYKHTGNVSVSLYVSENTWNDNDKRFIYEEIKPWRAEAEMDYYFIGSWGQVTVDREGDWDVDSNRHTTGNYFQTEEQAQVVADKINELFKEAREV